MFRGITTAAVFLLAAVPSSTNYVLKAYGFSNGGGSSSSSTYGLGSDVGSVNGASVSATYKLPSGIKASTTVPVPSAPTFTNPDSSYSRLKLTLNASSFPSDTKYLIAISSDGFATTKYVQTDNTIGTGLSIANCQTYSAWGGASGFWVLSLGNATTYAVKVAALQGSKTGSAFGPTASAATVTPSASFALSTSLTSTPPFNTSFASLPAGTPTTANATIMATVSTNAQNGGLIQISDQFNGLHSTSKSYTLASATADLSSVAKGYGAQVSGVAQSSGGPLTSVNPFDGTSNNVGSLTTALQTLASFSNPISNGVATISLIAKSDTQVPASTDYADILTITLAPVF